MKEIFNRYDKKLISQLPRAIFPGRIYVVNSPGETERAVAFLRSCGRVGIDTETKPSFHRGQTYQVALLQVSTYDTCFLFRLCELGLPDSLVALLEDEHVEKVGLSLADDWCMLRRRHEFEPRNCVDLQRLAPKVGVEDLSLQKLYANLLGGMISKRQQLSNWQADHLSEAQQLYAATDAWACLVIQDELNRLLDTHDYKLIINDDGQDKNIPAAR